MDLARQSVLRNTRVVTPLDEILKSVAEDFGISARRIKSASRGTKYESYARDEFCSVAYSAGYSLNDIGKFLRGRDHSTIWSAVQRARERIGIDT